MSRRTLLTSLAAGGLLLSLSACERPTPLVTLVSGSESVHSEATLFCFGGPDKQCVEDDSTDKVKVLKVKAGAPVGIDVDKELAEDGWYFLDADRKERSITQDGHYLSFVPSFQDRPLAGVYNLEIRSTESVDNEAPSTGRWRFVLVAE